MFLNALIYLPNLDWKFVVFFYFKSKLNLRILPHPIDIYFLLETTLSNNQKKNLIYPSSSSVETVKKSDPFSIFILTSSTVTSSCETKFISQYEFCLLVIIVHTTKKHLPALHHIQSKYHILFYIKKTPNVYVEFTFFLPRCFYNKKKWVKTNDKNLWNRKFTQNFETLYLYTWQRVKGSFTIIDNKVAENYNCVLLVFFIVLPWSTCA